MIDFTNGWRKEKMKKFVRIIITIISIFLFFYVAIYVGFGFKDGNLIDGKQLIVPILLLFTMMVVIPIMWAFESTGVKNENNVCNK